MRNQFFFTVVLPIVFWAFSAAVVGQSAKNDLSAEQILEKHLAAIGGKSNLEKIQTRVATGVVKVAKVGRPVQFLLFTESGNRLSAWYRLESFDWSFVFDGNKFSSAPIQLLTTNAVLTGRSARLEDKFKEMYSSGLMFGEISLYNILVKTAQGVTMKVRDMKKVHGRLAYVLEVKHRRFGLLKAYFDTETFMWVRTDYGSVELGDTRMAIDNSGGASLTIDFYQEYSDFRDIDGIKLPFKFKHMMIPPVSSNNRASLVEVEITDYKHNLKIDPKMFQ